MSSVRSRLQSLLPLGYLSKHPLMSSMPIHNNRDWVRTSTVLRCMCMVFANKQLLIELDIYRNSQLNKPPEKHHPVDNKQGRAMIDTNIEIKLALETWIKGFQMFSTGDHGDYYLVFNVVQSNLQVIHNSGRTHLELGCQISEDIGLQVCKMNSEISCDLIFFAVLSRCYRSKLTCSTSTSQPQR